MLGKYLGKGQVECHCVGFPQGEIILGVLEMPGTPQKRKRTANHQISPEIGKNCQQKTNETPHISHPFPLWPTGVFWKEMKGLWKK